jgi:2-polyprenyl-3-methyl-5-hydroxy-6-metoxy-1,4-benzoquinol methylase
MIKHGYAKLEDMKKIIDKKYKLRNFNIKTQHEMNKLYDVVTNVLNHMEDPKNALKTVFHDNRHKLATKLYDISNNITPI